MFICSRQKCIRFTEGASQARRTYFFPRKVLMFWSAIYSFAASLVWLKAILKQKQPFLWAFLSDIDFNKVLESVYKFKKIDFHNTNFPKRVFSLPTLAFPPVCKFFVRLHNGKIWPTPPLHETIFLALYQLFFIIFYCPLWL